jgi:hypothetical protein
VRQRSWGGYSVVGVVCGVALLAAASAAADEGWTPADAAAPPAAAVATKAAPKTVEQDPLPAPAVRSEASVQPVAAPAPAAPAAVSAESQDDQPPSPPEPEPPAPSGDPCASVDAQGECELPSSSCTRLGTDSADWLQGTDGDDVLCGLGGPDRLVGLDGDDVLVGGDGDDVLVGGDGDDRLTGGDGRDCFVGGPGRDRASDLRTPSEPASVEDPTTPDRARVLPDGSCGVQETKDYGAPGDSPPAAAGPAGAGAAFARASSADGPAGFPVEVLEGATAADGVVTLTLLCTAGDEAGDLVITDRRDRRLGKGPFRCDGTGAEVRIELTTRARRALRRPRRITARVRVTIGTAHTVYPLRIVRESDG